MEGPRNLQTARMGGLWTDVTARTRTVRALRSRAQAASAHIGPGVSAGPADPRPAHTERAADRQLAFTRRIRGLPARNRRRSRLHARRQLRPHPLAAFN